MNNIQGAKYPWNLLQWDPVDEIITSEKNMYNIFYCKLTKITENFPFGEYYPKVLITEFYINKHVE